MTFRIGHHTQGILNERETSNLGSDKLNFVLRMPASRFKRKNLQFRCTVMK